MSLCESCAHESRRWESYQQGVPFTGYIHHAEELGRRARLAIETKELRWRDRVETIRFELALIKRNCAERHQRGGS